MEAVSENGVRPNFCKMCSRIIFLEDVPIHEYCHSEYKLQAAEAAAVVRSQVDSILRAAFINVDTVLNRFVESFKWNTVVHEYDASGSEEEVPVTTKPPSPPEERPVPTRSLRKRRKSQLPPSKTRKTKKTTKTTQQKVSVNVQEAAETNIPVEPSTENTGHLLPPTTSAPSTSTTINHPPRTTISTSATTTTISTTTSVTPSSTTSTSTTSSVPLLRNTADQVSPLDDMDSHANLIGAGPLKVVFVTGLHVDTEIQDIKNFVSTKYEVSKIRGFHIHKLRIDPERGYSAFKIFVGRDSSCFTKLVNETVWPDGVVAKEGFRSPPAKKVINP